MENCARDENLKRSKRNAVQGNCRRNRIGDLSTYTIQEAWAASLTTDEFFDFGHRDWGTKTWNGASGTGVFYCNSNSGVDCSTPIPNPGGRYNYIKTTTKSSGAPISPGSPSNGAWAAAMQGMDPWKHCEAPNLFCASNGGATNRNANIYNSIGSYQQPAHRSDGLHYKVGAQYYWFKDATSKPDSGAATSGDATLRGRLMTNLWFVDTASAKVCNNNYWKNVVVMDITWVNLKAASESGNKVWAYESISDAEPSSSKPGVQYNTIFWNPNGS